MGAENIQKIIPSQGTRLKWLMFATLLATAAWLLSFFGFIDAAQAVSFNDWGDFQWKVFAVYGTTEVGAKGAYAVMNKNG